jgi:hypothetical protein
MTAMDTQTLMTTEELLAMTAEPHLPGFRVPVSQVFG